MDSYAQCLHSNPRSRVSRDSRDTVWLRDIWDRICVIERQLGLGVLNIKERSIPSSEEYWKGGGMLHEILETDSRGSTNDP